MGVVTTTCTPLSSLPLPVQPRGCFVARRFLLPSRRRTNSCDGEALIISRSTSTVGLQRCASNLESVFCYDKSQVIEEHVGLSLEERDIGDYPPCVSCKTKGVSLCATCSGCGLYVDSILESQGVIIKVRCLGCGGTGSIMCLECGGRGHV